MNFFLILFATLFFSFYLGCDNSTQREPLLSDLHNEAMTKLQKETCEKLNAPGAVLYVRFPDGLVWNKAYGYASIDGDRSQKLNTDMQFRIASVTKTFVGSAILKIVSENQFQLIDNIEKFLPGFLKYREKITVQMLLNHNSAIPDYATND